MIFSAYAIQNANAQKCKCPKVQRAKNKKSKEQKEQRAKRAKKSKKKLKSLLPDRKFVRSIFYS